MMGIGRESGRMQVLPNRHHQPIGDMKNKLIEIFGNNWNRLLFRPKSHLCCSLRRKQLTTSFFLQISSVPADFPVSRLKYAAANTWSCCIFNRVDKTMKTEAFFPFSSLGCQEFCVRFCPHTFPCNSSEKVLRSLSNILDSV